MENKMATVMAVAESLANNVMEHLPGQAILYVPSVDDVPPLQLPDEGPRRLVEFVRAHCADVLVLGVRLGGNAYLAMDAARTLLAERVKYPDAPAVVLVSPTITMALAKHSWEIGVFSIVETERPDRARLSHIVADEILLARAWREGRGERASFRLPSAAPSLRPRSARKSPAKKRAS